MLDRTAPQVNKVVVTIWAYSTLRNTTILEVAQGPAQLYISKMVPSIMCLSGEEV